MHDIRYAVQLSFSHDDESWIWKIFYVGAAHDGVRFVICDVSATNLEFFSRINLGTENHGFYSNFTGSRRNPSFLEVSEAEHASKMNQVLP